MSTCARSKPGTPSFASCLSELLIKPLRARELWEEEEEEEAILWAPTVSLGKKG